MKHFIFKTLFIILVGVAFSPVVSFAANPPVIVFDKITSNSSSTTVGFKMTTAPSQATNIYASIRDVAANSWVKRDIYLREADPGDQTPLLFDVSFGFSDLHLQPNKVYQYYLADAVTEPIYYLFIGPKCFTTTGPIDCNANPSTVTPTTNSPTTPPQTTSATVPPVVFPTASPTAASYQTPPMTFGGISVTFPRESQVITETSAEIHGIVSTLITIPVELSFVSGVAGSPLGNAQSLFTTTLMPGQTWPITMNFTGLNAGSSYYFVLRNKATGTSSHAIYFTTPGGATHESASFAGQRLGRDGVPPSIAIEDTISDKGIVPRCGRTAGPNVPLEETRMCGYKDFLQLISNIINYAIIILGPIIAVFVMYTGVMIIIYGKKGDPTGAVMEKLKAYKKRLLNIAVGVLIMLLAWTIIATILKELGVKPNYILLDLFN